MLRLPSLGEMDRGVRVRRDGVGSVPAQVLFLPAVMPLREELPIRGFFAS